MLASFSRLELNKLCNSQLSAISLELDGETKPLSTHLDYVSRNDCLSESGIYSRQHNFNASQDKIIVISGSSEAKIYGYIPEDDALHFIRNKPCLACVTRGKAGNLTFLKKETYATNTNAMLLFIQDNSKKELDIQNQIQEEEYLRFLKFYLQSKFLNYASNSDLSVFPMSKAIEDINIFFPKYNKSIANIAQIDFELSEIKRTLQNFKKYL